MVEYRQEPIPPSDYHTLLEHEAAADDRHTANNDDKLKVAPRAADPDVRFWSDYSRVFLHPRSSQRLPDTPDWESTEGNWLWSKETFERHNAVCLSHGTRAFSTDEPHRTPTSWKSPSDCLLRSATTCR